MMSSIIEVCMRADLPGTAGIGCQNVDVPKSNNAPTVDENDAEIVALHLFNAAHDAGIVIT